MPLLTCPDCKKEVSDQAAACPNCGRPIAVSVSPPLAILSGIAGLLGLVGYGLVLYLVALFMIEVLGAPAFLVWSIFAALIVLVLWAIFWRKRT